MTQDEYRKQQEEFNKEIDKENKERLFLTKNFPKMSYCEIDVWVSKFKSETPDKLKQLAQMLFCLGCYRKHETERFSN